MPTMTRASIHAGMPKKNGIWGSRSEHHEDRQLDRADAAQREVEVDQVATRPGTTVMSTSSQQVAGRGPTGAST